MVLGIQTGEGSISQVLEVVLHHQTDQVTDGLRARVTTAQGRGRTKMITKTKSGQRVELLQEQTRPDSTRRRTTRRLSL